jgi:hypothetical protein
MSRDFLVRFASEADASEGERILLSAKASDGQNLFFVENRGSEIFSMLVYPNAIEPGFTISANGVQYQSFEKDVAFVAIKNGQHNGIGYFVDTGWNERSIGQRFPLKDTFRIISEVFSVDVTERSAA